MEQPGNRPDCYSLNKRLSQTAMASTDDDTPEAVN
jgi:hypothetical protein